MGKFNKAIAGVVTLALVATLAIGVNFGAKTKAEAVNVITDNWTNYAESYEDNDKDVAKSVITSTPDKITANIKSTGWSSNWWGAGDEPWENSNAISLPTPEQPDGDSFWGDNPFQLRSENTVAVVKGTSYTLSFTVENQMTKKGTYVDDPIEKNLTVVVKGTDQNKTVFVSETVRVGTYEDENDVVPFEFTINVPRSYRADTVNIIIAYGAYAASYGVTQFVAANEENPGTYCDENGVNIDDARAKLDQTLYAYPTTESTSADGTLIISDIKMMGEAGVIKTTDAPATTKKVVEPTTSGSSEVTTAAPEATTAAAEVTTAAAVTQKLAMVTGVKAKNNKKGKVTVSWKKVTNAKKYQVKVGTKKKAVSKLKYVAKVKKGKTVKIQVRALANGNYKAGAWSKAVKVKVKK